LACASKWSALWFLLLILCKEVFTLKNRKQLPFLIFVLVLTPLFIYFLAYLPLLYQENGLAQFFTLQKTMLQSQLSNPTLHAYSSRPLAWILNLRPVWYFTAVSHVSQPNWVSNIYALDNPLLHLYMILTLPVGFWYLMKNKLRATAKRGVYFLIAFYLVSFLPWLFFKRIMFFYHYLPAIPFLLILTAYFFLRLLREVKNKNNYLAIFFNVLFWPFLFFVIFYPHWTALSVPAAFAQIFYFGLASWR
jgi:dolichyl-phosphate-mannose--protein O-mannosyl transferase